MKAGKHTKLVREADYVAEVEVDLLNAPEAWGPHLSLEDARKLDAVRAALRVGDFVRASSMARVYRLMPVAS